MANLPFLTWLKMQLTPTSYERKVLLFIIGILILGDSFFLIKKMVFSRKQRDPYALQLQSAQKMDKDELFEPAETIDINNADWEELIKLPGVGPVIARRIKDEREKKPFETLEDLKKRVKGIGEQKLKQILPYIYFGK